jgi:hypothetical protein
MTHWEDTQPNASFSVFTSQMLILNLIKAHSKQESFHKITDLYSSKNVKGVKYKEKLKKYSTLNNTTETQH